MNNIRVTCKYFIHIFLLLTASAVTGFSQLPFPTPLQYPAGYQNNPCEPTVNCSMIAYDDFGEYPGNGPYWVQNNDDSGGGEVYITSQSYTYGTMFEGNSHVGNDLNPRSVVRYARNTTPGYGVDTGYYYVRRQRFWDGQYFATNLAKITILVVPRDDAENAGASCPVVAQPVNVANGNMWLHQTDYNLPGIGERIEINRFYNTIKQVSGYFGFGWSTKYDESLEFYDGNLIRLNMPDGQAVYFVRENASNYFAPATPQSYMRVDQNSDGTYDVTFKGGRVHRFDSAGRLLWQKDRDGNQTTLSYNNGFLTGVTDSSERTLTINLNGNKLASSISDGLGTIATYTYYETNSSLLKEVAYQDGSKYKFEYQTLNGKVLLKTVKDAFDNILETHDYDLEGRAITSEKQGGVEKYTFDYTSWNSVFPFVPYTLVKHKKNPTDANFVETKYYYHKPGDMLGNSQGRYLVTKIQGNCNCGGSSESTDYEYDHKGNVKKMTNALGQVTSYAYDHNGNRLSQTDVNGTETFTYNSFGQVLTRTDRMGGVWTNTYDAGGKLKTTKDPLNNVTTIEYPLTDNKGLPDSVKDARLNITKYKWFPSGLLEEVEDANLKKTNYTYDARSRVKTVTNALNHVTTYNYFDDAQRKVEIIYPNLDKITYKYDARRLLESITDERGKLTNYEFDAAYRLKKIIDPLGHAKEFGYDLMSNRTSVTDALGNATNYEYDDFNRLKEIQYPPAEVGAARLEEKFEYDAIGRIKKHYDTANRLTEYGYDDANRTNTMTSAQMEATTMKYNQRFQTVEVKDALNQIYNFTYDPLGRQLSQTRAGTTMSYQYDAVGNQTLRTDYTGRQTAYEYDALNRLKKITYLQPTRQTRAPTTTYVYDDISQLKTATNAAGTVTFNYDNRNRIESATDVFGHTLNYEYELSSTVNQKRLKFNGAMYAKYNFDDANRLANIIDATDNTTITFGSDNADRLESRVYPNGITTTYGYDDMSRLKSLKDVSPTETVFDRQYGYSAANQISQIAEIAQTRNFVYDNVDRLTSMTNGAANETYNYDAVGNRMSSHRSATYSYQPNNKLTNTATATYSYNSNGNMISKSDASGSWTYAWDYENRMTSASNGTNSVSYVYDALGRRVKRTQGASVTKFTYDGLDVVLDDENGVLTKYQNGIGIDNKLKLTSGGVSKYFLTDHLGSTSGLVDSSGNLTASNSYDSFGNTTNTSFPTRYQYTGREYDSFTSLYYYRARFYDANLGRFISEDPIGFDGGDVNLFAYVKNNPIRFKDPTGNIPLLPIAVGGSVLAGELGLHTGLSYLADNGYANLGNDVYGRKRHCWVNCVSTRLHLGNPMPVAIGGYAKEVVNIYQDTNLWDDSKKDINANQRGQFLGLLFWRSCEELCNECQPEQ